MSLLPPLEEVVREELELLPSRQRTCLNLFYADGYSYEEISELSGFSLSSVRSYMQNGKIALKKSLGKRDGRSETGPLLQRSAAGH